MGNNHTEQAPTVRSAEDLLQRAREIGADFAAADANISTGPTIADLLRRYSTLLSDADAAGFGRERIQDIIDTAFAPRQ